MDNNKVWGYLRETTEMALEAGVDPANGMPRTGLDEYLKEIFPETTDWIHDKPIKMVNGKKCRYRPDYRSESLKLIIEYDGVQHYTSPKQIRDDEERTALYTEGGYKVVRIPYFIQLSQKVVNRMFGKDVGELFDDDIASMSIESIKTNHPNTPAFMCPAGIARMAKEFHEYSPEQYETNIRFLIGENDEFLTGALFLQKAYQDYSE